MKHQPDQNPDNVHHATNPMEPTSHPASGAGLTSDHPLPQPGFPFQRPGFSLARYATGFKLALMFFLTLGFLIPLGMLSDLTHERQSRQREAINETSQAWADELSLGAPVLVVPVDYRYRDSKDQEATGQRQVLVYPDSIDIQAELNPQLRQRGIFTIPLYSLKATITGAFSRPSLGEMGADLIRAHWDRAYLVFMLPDFRSLSQAPHIDWGGLDLSLGSPRSDMLLSGPALTAPLAGIDWTGQTPFSLSLDLKGSDSFSVLPLATTTNVTLVSSWPRPSFFGSALPDTRSIGPSGMTATWKVIRFGLGRSANAPMENGLIQVDRLLENAQGQESGTGDTAARGFGFRLYPDSSAYQLTDRSLKYGILFIIIPFAALFLIEALRRLRVHPVQYVLIGLANCLFFLLLLAISEQTSFNLAFLVAALTVIILIAVYCAWILPERRDGWLMGALLAGLYGYMFTALQSEDYALLIGAVGLVLILAGIMAATRNINWYRLGSTAAKVGGGHPKRDAATGL